MTVAKDAAAHHVRETAERLYGEFETFADELLVAGSIRRGKKHPSDIDFVCLPKLREVQPSLLDGAGKSENLVRSCVMRLEQAQILRIELNGQRMQRFHFQGVKVDMFYADEMNFGYIAMLRTGPGRFSKRVVTEQNFGGLRPRNVFMSEGYVYHAYNGQPSAGSVMQVRTEQDLFGLLGIDFIAPEDRR